MPKLRALFFSLTLLLNALSVSAKITLPAIIQSNMVLQQQSKVLLWGNARSNSKVTINASWSNSLYITKADADGSWKTTIKTPSAGGPYEITFSDGDRLKLTNILIGEVWICSGQSNMEIPVIGYSFWPAPILNSNDIILNANNSQIRLFHVERAFSKTPLKDCNGTWEESNTQTVREFSAVGYLYAKILQQKLKVPVGIIESAVGATVIETWMNKNSLAAFPEINSLNPTDTSKMDKNNPTVAFNGMINPLAGFCIKGVIWYQGEQNCFEPKLYDKLMSAMVKGWRELWGQGNLPFYYVQIAPYKYPQGELVPFLREAQLKAMKEIPNSGMVVSLDVGSKYTIHPPDKLTISKRLAYWALAKTYGWKGLAYSGPIYKDMKISGNSIKVYFDHDSTGLTSYGKELSCFEIAGKDKIFHPAKAKIMRDGTDIVIVQSDSVQSPVAVRYGFKDWVTGDLYNVVGLPASPFRTDDW
ncbi:MAG: sialate O-acetylesterase [Ignavibacteriaceae bacterium]